MIEIYIEQMLKLNPSNELIKEISEVLENAILTMDQYHKLVIKLLESNYDLKNYNEVITIGSNYYNSNKFNENFDNDNIFKLIIESANHLKKYNISYEYINIRKEHLPIMKQYLALVDLIYFKKATNQSYISDINNLLEDSIPDNIKKDLLNELLSVYLSTGNENKVIPLIDELKKCDPHKSYIPNYLKALFNLKFYDDAKNVALENIDNPNYKKDSVITLLKVYLENKNYHKATILDADYKNNFEGWDLESQLIVYNLLIELYKELNNKYSTNIYQRLKDKTVRKLKQINKEDLVLIEDEKPEVTAVKITKTKLKYISVILELIVKSHQVSNNIKIRDILRDFFIQVETYFEALDYIVFTEKDRILYNYKKNRLYDKPLLKTTYEKTIINEVLKSGNDYFGSYNDFKQFENILTNSPYTNEISYIYAFPILDLGVFIVHLNERINDPGTYYDLFKGINNIIYTILVDHNKVSNLKNSNHFLRKVFDSEIIALKIIEDKIQTSNNKAQKILNVNSIVPVELFLNNLNIIEANHYLETIKELSLKPNTTKEIFYSVGDKQIKETFISILDQDVLKIVSVINDLTLELKEKDALIKNAIMDYETHLLNINALNEDLIKYLNSKGSLILISFNETILPIYGYDVTLQFFKEFGQITKKIFNKGTLYRFSTYELFLYLPINDIRAVKNELNNYFKEINLYESKIIPYEKFSPKMAVIRYPVVTEEKNPAKLFRYLELTLDSLKRMKNNYYLFFEYDIYEKELYEQQVIDLLNTAIKNKNLSLSFNQIIDKNYYVWKYESFLSIDNLDIPTQYLYRIAKKRNRLYELEKYHIEAVLKFLNTLRDETNQLIKVTIPIDKETINNSDFNSFIHETLHTYKIPKDFISFYIHDLNKVNSELLLKLNDLYKNNIAIETSNIDLVLKYPFNTLYLDYDASNKWLNYLKIIQPLLDQENIDLVIGNVKTSNERDKLINLNINLVKGESYESINSEKLLLKIKKL